MIQGNLGTVEKQTHHVDSLAKEGVKIRDPTRPHWLKPAQPLLIRGGEFLAQLVSLRRFTLQDLTGP